MGLLVGIGIGTTRAFGGFISSRLARGYAALFRGTPLVIQLFVLYFGLPNLGIYLSPYAAAVIGFTLCSGAYHSEYIRGGLLSIKRGQVAAAHALGFSTMKTMYHVIIPQALRRALPGCGNEIIYLIKYSSLAYIITCIELTGEGKVLASKTFRFTEVFLIVGLYYLVLVSLATMGLHWLERRLAVPGFGHSRN
jgi:polar amino acid transport system permease protein